MSDEENFLKLRTLHRALTLQWAELCERFLPMTVPDSFWRYSRNESGADPAQGWKLHISATVLSAVRVFETVAPVLSARNVWFKAPASLTELEKLNRGTVYGYSQVGKFITVYPRSTEAAVQLAHELHRLTRRLPCPDVPFDFSYSNDSCVYYRYGAFKSVEIEVSNGERGSALRAPHGNLIPDRRDSPATFNWVPDPFPITNRTTTKQTVTELETTFRAFRAFTQRGKGGVYQAVDLSSDPPRFCVIKQGRRHGEVSWDGRDGRWRVKHEQRVLNSLKRSGIPVPLVYSSFKSKTSGYLVTEFVEGESLEQTLNRRKRRLSIAAALKRSAEVARLLDRIHACGWVWRDCKPGNLIISKNGQLRPLDFEGACLISRPDPLPWSTPGFTPTEARNRFARESQVPEDNYALGVIIYLLFAGRLPNETTPIPLQRMRKNAPAPVCRLVAQLLDTNPRIRPRARTTALRLEAALKLKTSWSNRQLKPPTQISKFWVTSKRIK